MNNCHCLRCGHHWEKRRFGRPSQCPACHQYRWDVEPLAGEKLPAREIDALRAENQALRAALSRVRQGYLNILEMRKLSGDQWGQRDGYGGRYGALTREEIEGVMADIDAALGKAGGLDLDAGQEKEQEKAKS